MPDRLPPPSFSDLRLRALNGAPLNPDGDYVLYWMVAARRTAWNFALQRAAEIAGALGVGLLVFEPLRCDYPCASDRLHRFILEGMADNAAALADSCACYLPYVEPEKAAGRGLLAALAQHACMVVSDDFPCFFIPRMQLAAARQLPVRLELVDGNGLLPMAAADKDYPTAYAFRRLLHKALPAFIDDRPAADPLQGLNLPGAVIPSGVPERWPAADLKAQLRPGALAALPIDHGVEPVGTRGGSRAALACWRGFLNRRLADYPEARNIPDRDATSGLSPYLHFGHISVHQIFTELATTENWDSSRLPFKPTGKRAGWWRMSEAAEAFLDQLVTWRELGYGFCRYRPDHADYAGLPDWARATLDEHRLDARAYLYDGEQFENAATHDPLWNAAQTQLVREGRLHGYLRMLWGKKILEWSADPETALATMLRLNDRWALDGRDPNSISGISWCLGRFDRPWGPERPVFGKIRYMTSENTARKVAVRDYLSRYAPQKETHP